MDSSGNNTLAGESSTHGPTTGQPVTVVIPAYNLERYVADTIASVQAQTYSLVQKILVLDDGSTDATKSILDRLAAQSQGLIEVRTQANCGRAVTRDKLLRMAETNLVAWIDADDIAVPGWIEQQVQYMQKHPECVAVSAQGYAMDATGFAIGPLTRPLDHAEIDRRHISGQPNAFFQSCVLTKRDALLQVGGYRKCYSAAEDYDLWLRLARVGQLANLPETHLIYRVHPTSANSTQSVSQRQQGQLCMNEAREQRGLDPIEEPVDEIPQPSKDDWNRRIYWINIALSAGNPFSACKMASRAVVEYPLSLVMWGAWVVSAVDAGLFWGNRTPRFRVGQTPRLGCLPRVSCFRLARSLLRWRRRLKSRLPP